MPSDGKKLRYVIGAYSLTAALLVVFSFFPAGRVWGFNLLAFFPAGFRYALIPILLLLPAVTVFIASRPASDSSAETASASGRFLWFGVVLVVVSAVLFYVFRATTYFDGDGYISLANLSEGARFVKFEDFGAMAVQIGLYSLLGKGGKETAVLVYQLISYLSGVLFLALILLMARELFARLSEQILFVLVMATGGYALMFFGYVENYPLFIVAVVLYLYVGVLVLKRGVSRWWILVSNLIAAFFHILGLTLLPATVYLLIRDSRLGKWLGERSALVKLSLAVLTAASLAACFFYLFFTSYPFRFAFLPVVRDRFTASGYTMFSGKHLLDIANQLILLSPGLLVLAVFGVSTRERLAATSQLFRFAVLVLACSLTSVLIFDPKLGMARDWDLFGFVGVALNFLLLVFVLGRKKSNRPALIAALLAVALSGTFLVARVAAKRTDDIAIKRLESFTPLDPVRNNKNGLLISTYYLDHGDSLKGLQIDSAWQRSNRDIFMCAYGKALFDSGKVVQALSAYRQAIAINPFEAIGYNNLGHAFTNVGQLDSGRYYLQIAQGLRPKNGMIKCNLGWIAFQQGDDEEAEKLWLESIKLDSASITPQMFLLRLYKKDNRIAKYLERLPRVAEYKDAPMMILVEASLDYYQRRQIQDARRLWNRAVALGLDSAKCEQVLRQYPELRENKQNK